MSMATDHWPVHAPPPHHSPGRLGSQYSTARLRWFVGGRESQHEPTDSAEWFVSATASARGANVTVCQQISAVGETACEDIWCGNQGIASSSYVL